MEATADDYYQLLLGLRPRGPAWPEEDPKLKVLGEHLARAHNRGLSLLSESLAGSTIEMLDAWERNYGLPDPCAASAGADTIPERQKALVAKKVARGGQSKAYFQAIIDAMGYTATIQERRPFRCGISQCGGKHEVGSGPDVRFYWRVHVSGKRIQEFRAGAGRCGQDKLGAVRRAKDLECVLHSFAPAHTHLTVIYE